MSTPTEYKQQGCEQIKMNRPQLQFAQSQNFPRGAAMKDSKLSQMTPKQITRIVNLGFSMKLVLMQIDGIKIVEEIIKIIRKMNSASFGYKQQMDLTCARINKMIHSVYDDPTGMSPLASRKCEKAIEKQMNAENLQMYRQQLIQSIVEELYNARQDALKIGQQDPTLSFTNSEDNLQEKQKELKDFVSNFTKDQGNSDTEIQELMKTVSKLENETRIYKKMLQDSTKTAMKKDEKIQSLKNTISKLEQLIIKQVSIQNSEPKSLSQKNKSQNDSDKLKVGNDPNLIKSQALERQVVQLKSEIENLRENLAQSARLNKKDMQSQNMIASQRQNEFLALSREYASIKKQIIQIVKLEKKAPVLTKFSQDQSKCSESEEANYKVEFELLQENYRALNNAYISLKEEFSKVSSKQPPIIKKQSDFSISSPKMHKDSPNQKIKKLKVINTVKHGSDPRASKMKNSSKRLDFGTDEQEIMRDINEINKIQNMSSSIGISSFQAIIDAAEMGKKIQGFEYTNSIIHKVNSSKFIQSFEAKLSLILQYVCLIELYFAKNFLSCIREELMMQDSITIKSITIADLNPTLFNEPPAQQDSSFNANNSSKLSIVSSPNRLSLGNPRQDNTKNTSPIDDHLSDSAISLPNPNPKYSPEKEKTRKKIQELEAQMKQISSLITDQYLNPHELRQEPDFILRVQKLKSNRIAVVITNLVKQNEVFKKCLNQMIKSQQNFTKQNNQVYFDEEGQLRRRSSSTSNMKVGGPEGKVKDKENCFIM